MGVITYEVEVPTSLPPARIFKAFVLDFDNLLPKAVPQAIKSCELVQGDGGPGSIKKVTFGEGGPFKYVVHKVDGIDKENFTYNYSAIEGDALKDKFEKICFETKFEAAPGGGTICKSIRKYYTIGDTEIKEEDIKAGKERSAGMYQAVEAYLLANPDLYN
ncbi:hypothetical protein DITRI_Ditri15bG0129700 [Diplodiscus trichospermus]